MVRIFLFVVMALFLALTPRQACAASKVTLDILLRQMTDLSLLAEYPDPPFITRQFSSYDRASEKPGQESWFANSDRGFMLYDGVVSKKTPYFKAGPQQGRTADGFFEPNTKVGIAPTHHPVGEYVWVYATGLDGRPVQGKTAQGYVAKSAIQMDRQGHVLAEMEGPGCVVRIWSPNPKDGGNLRIYLDEAKDPVVDAPMEALLGGKWQMDFNGKKWTPFADPIACERSRGWNLYFPVAYAKHCKITVDKPDVYYHVDYRTYPQNTDVATFRLEDWARERPPEAQKMGQPFSWLARSSSKSTETWKSGSYAIAPGEEKEIFKFEGDKPQAIQRFEIYLDKPKNEAEVLRSLRLTGAFDGVPRPQIDCPLGDFFGSAPGVNSYESLPISVSRNKDQVVLRSFWCMPFAKSAVFKVHNYSDETVNLVSAGENDSNYSWTNRSMHFNGKWRSETLMTRPFRDWNYCDLKGQGVFIGDMLSVTNPVPAWWGEGDEKIYVEGEVFPSWFGTGTEDYYGFGWSNPQLFQHPYHNQTRCDGPGNQGHTSVNRFHILDAIPFTQSFRFDMEFWHWTPNIQVNYTATSYWYAKPGGNDNFVGLDAKTLHPIPQPK